MRNKNYLLNFDQMNESRGVFNSPLKNMKFGAIDFDFGVEMSEYNWKKWKNNNGGGRRGEEWREKKEERGVGCVDI